MCLINMDEKKRVRKKKVYCTTPFIKIKIHAKAYVTIIHAKQRIHTKQIIIFSHERGTGSEGKEKEEGREELKRKREIGRKATCSRIQTINTVNISTVSKLIYTFNKILIKFL